MPDDVSDIVNNKNNDNDEETSSSSFSLRRLGINLPTVEEQKCDRAYRRLWERNDQLRNTSEIYTQNLTATIAALEFFDVCTRDDEGVELSCVYPTYVPSLDDFVEVCTDANATILNETTTFNCKYDASDGRGKLTMTYPLTADCIPTYNPNCNLDYFREKQEVDERVLQSAFKDFLLENDFENVVCSHAAATTTTTGTLLLSIIMTMASTWFRF